METADAEQVGACVMLDLGALFVAHAPKRMDLQVAACPALRKKRAKVLGVVRRGDLASASPLSTAAEYANLSWTPFQM